MIYIFCTVVFVPSRADLFSDLSDSGHFEDFEVPLRTFRIQPKHFYDSKFMTEKIMTQNYDSQTSKLTVPGLDPDVTEYLDLKKYLKKFQ